jgi:hypothetical protein
VAKIPCPVCGSVTWFRLGYGGTGCNQCQIPVPVVESARTGDYGTCEYCHNAMPPPKPKTRQDQPRRFCKPACRAHASRAARKQKVRDALGVIAEALKL